jgi:hypothetical protein
MAGAVGPCQCCQLLANVIGQKIRKIRPLAENFGHSHYFPIDAGFTAFKKDSCHTKLRTKMGKYVD